MTSPSSSSTRRSTPCVLGCCGPMFTVIVSVRISAMPLHAIALDVGAELGLADLERLVGLRGLANLHRIVLPRRVAFPVLRHQQPAEIAIAVEEDAEHVPDFTLGPAGAAPDTLHRRHRAGDTNPNLQAQAQLVLD